MGRCSGAAKFKQKFVVQLGGRDFLHFFQGFDAALRLRGFGGFGFEAVDKRLQMLDFGLLFGERGLLVCQALRAFFQVEIVAAAVEREFLLCQFKGLRGGGVEKIAVVRNDDLRAGQVCQVVFQPQHGFQIQVVGRFVQQQQIGAAHQGLREVEPHPPAARKA